MSGRRIFAACVLAALACAAPAVAAVPIDSTSGSGASGRWGVDDAGLPVYRYTLDQALRPVPRQPELLGRTDAWHQIGNERIDRHRLQRRPRSALEPGPPLPVGQPL